MAHGNWVSEKMNKNDVKHYSKLAKHTSVIKVKIQGNVL